MDKKQILSVEDKKIHFGEGEWLDEPDLVEFTHGKIKCIIMRIINKEHYYHFFGGFLCGYCEIPKDHKYYLFDYSEIPYEVHGGLTFGECNEKGEYWIGFDCSHSFDYVPSLEEWKKIIGNPYSELLEKLKGSRLLNPTYKNLNFVIEECKRLAEQIETEGARPPLEEES